MGSKVPGETVYVIGQISPSTRNAFNIGLAAELTFVTDLFRNTGNFRRKGVELIHHGIYRGTDAKEFPSNRPAFDLKKHLLREVTLRHGRDYARNLVGWRDKVTNQLVHRVHRCRPGAFSRAY